MKRSIPARATSLAGAVATAALLAACSTVNTSELLGSRYHRAPIDTYPVQIATVDGRSYLLTPVRIEPGRHEVSVQAPPTATRSPGAIKTVTLDVKPCTRVYLVAVKPNRLANDFDVKVDHEERLSGCVERQPG